MIKKLLLLLMSAAAILPGAKAQNTLLHCDADNVRKQAIEKDPSILQIEANLEQEIQARLKSGSLMQLARTTGANDTVYHIPIVFHVVHDYGGEDVSDNDIYDALKQINRIYARQNPDTVDVIPNFAGNIPGTNIEYKGKANLEFDLATIDPSGNPTHGITRNHTFLSFNAGEEAKVDLWDRTKYLNIWIVRNFSGLHSGAAAYAYTPALAQNNPYGDGVILIYSYLNYDNTVSHEIGHEMNLEHPWGNTNNPQVACGDDNVDDTPPTQGHYNPSGCVAANLYDTLCTGHVATLGKTSITSPFATNGAADTSTSNNISFSTRTGVTISSVVIYPSAAINTPFSVVLTNSSNTVLKTYSDLIQSAADSVKTLPLNFRVEPGTGYKLQFSINPGARRGVSGGTYTKTFAGGITFASDSTPGRYNYFYNWKVQYGFFKIYANDSLVDYPDTVNSQNIMDYTYCSKMFTYGQVMRERAAILSATAGRNNLISASNLAATGALAPWPKLKPIADMSATRPFICANNSTTTGIVNQSWNDTVTSAAWTFSNGASPATSTSLTTTTVKFSTPGWTTIALTATNVAGSSTLTNSTMVYAADTTAADPGNYFQEFSGSDLGKWPVFNTFTTDHKWELVNNAGYLDNTSMRFYNIDARSSSDKTNATQSPAGAYSDFYSPAWNLSNFGTGVCNLTFYTAGAFRTNTTANQNDTLQIAYSINCGVSWVTMSNITRADLGNNGVVTASYLPTSKGEWLGHALNIPANARTARTFFRYRFKAGSDLGTGSGFTYGTGNNFYLDRINITASPLGIDEAAFNQHGMVVAPNPTSGSAVVMIKGGDNSAAQIQVTDITGKVVYHTQAKLAAAATQVTIPAETIAVKGMYLVTVVTNGQAQTQKLVVY